MGTLDGRVALVTGAGRSVGEGIAQELAEAGAAVAVNDLHPDRAEAVAAALRAAGAKSIATPFDVRDLAAVRAGIARVAAELGPVDILVSNAGIPEEHGQTGPFLDSDPSLWHVQVDLNLFGAMNCIRSALPGMVERGWGRIVQISSGAGSRAVPGMALYGASKAGIEGLVRTVAVEVAQTGVTMNSIALGLMANTAANINSENMQALFAGMPMRRLGQPREVGACVAWLCSEKGSWVTGQTIHLNGGTVLGR